MHALSLPLLSGLFLALLHYTQDLLLNNHEPTSQWASEGDWLLLSSLYCGLGPMIEVVVVVLVVWRL